MRENQDYVSIPGSRTHELPPLLVHATPGSDEMSEVLNRASVIVETDDIVPQASADESVMEQRKFELALRLVEQYRGLVAHWHWGDSILEWIRQCEITFESQAALRPLLHPDVWPHAGRSSFVTLLMDKHVPTHGVAVDKAVGMRLTFRQPPPIDFFSNQFLFFLNPAVAGSAYETWAHIAAGAALLPPERFHFDVVSLD